MNNNKKRFPLHWQIVLALILGAIFGALLPVDPYLLKLSQSVEGAEKETLIEGWESVSFAYIKEKTQINEKFGKDSQLQIINKFKSLKPEEKKSLTIEIIKGDTLRYANVASIQKEGSVATEIKPIGTIFINLLSFLAIPLVLASLIVGAASLDDIKKLGRIGSKTFILYMTTTAIAVIIGLAAANIIAPGERIDSDTKSRLLGEFQSETSEKIVENIDVDIVDFFIGIIPKNPIKAMAEGNMLQIVFFAVMFGMTLTFIEKQKSELAVNFFSAVSDTMIKMVDFIMKIAPFGVFALISATISEFGFNIISTLIWYIVAVVSGLIIHTIGVYYLVVKIYGKVKPMDYFRGIRTAQAIAFSSSSSAATLPVTMECAEQNLKLPKHITGFVLPLGATINMDGTALYQGVAAVFIAQVYGFDLNLAQQLTIVFTAVLASIGTAPVPGVGIIMLIMILQAVQVPPEGIALIIGVDRILDMCRTITNISGDIAVAVAVAGSEEKRALKMKG